MVRDEGKKEAKKLIKCDRSFSLHPFAQRRAKVCTRASCVNEGHLTKPATGLVSRQFVEMPRSRIEGLLSAFPKLIGSQGQHTFVETDSVRYVYQVLLIEFSLRKRV
jgi:hypothetical protein